MVFPFWRAGAVRPDTRWKIMNKENLPMLSDCEFEIMDCVWSSPQAPTQTGIMRWVNEKCGKNLKVATIATYNRRIIWKGYMEKMDNDNWRPTYHALVSKDEYFERYSQMFLKRWGDERVLQMAKECIDRYPEEREPFLAALRSAAKQ